MITLKTLPQATAQEVFDQVALHLLTQNKQSADIDFINLYRYRGLKCAAGCLIGDDEYEPHFENKSWSSLVELGYVPPEHYDLITRLQRVHDNYLPFEWKDRLEIVSIEWKLNRKIFNDKRIKK